jgi:replication-associated recombination protein RarA
MCSSRCRRTELGQLLDRAAAAALPGMTIDSTARDALIAYADGDGRRLINMVEQLATAAGEAGTSSIDLAFVETTIARSLRRFDKGGEAFYDQISALHKSVRGSSPDAALYWMCRMLDGGADPLYVGRRLIRMASEDIGLADPRALAVTMDCRRRLRAPGDARRRAGARRGSDLPRLRAEVERGVHGLQRGAARSSPRTAPGRCRCGCAMRPPG